MENAYDLIHPLMLAEYLTWLDWNCDRVWDAIGAERKSKWELGAFKEHFFSGMYKRDNELSIYASIIIGVHLLGMKGLEGVDATEEEKANALCRVADLTHMDHLKEMFRQDGKEGVESLNYMLHPHSANMLRHLPPFSIFTDAHYRKAGSRVYKFLMALGEPDKGLRLEFLKSVLHISMRDDGKFAAREYEQHLMLDVSEGGSTRTVFIDFLGGPVTCDVIVREKGMEGRTGLYIVSPSLELSGKEYIQEGPGFLNTDGDKYKWAFDLLVNAWLAEVTGMTVKAEEPVSERARTQNIVRKATGRRKPIEGIRYEYIKVTDKAWELHKESQRALSTHRADSTWTKEFWWRKQHFSSRNGKKVFIQGHWCHRRCGEVIGDPDPVVEVLI